MAFIEIVLTRDSGDVDISSAWGKKSSLNEAVSLSELCPIMTVLLGM